MNDNCCGEKLVALGTVIALQIASESTPDELNVLGALFNVIGDQLSLLAATRVSGETG